MFLLGTQMDTNTGYIMKHAIAAIGCAALAGIVAPAASAKTYDIGTVTEPFATVKSPTSRPPTTTATVLPLCRHRPFSVRL